MAMTFDGANKSGLRSIRFADASSPTGISGASARVSFGYPDSDSSLLHELEQGDPPTPWACKYTRDQSLDILERSGWIQEEVRARMSEYGRRLPWYSYREESDPSAHILWVRFVDTSGLAMGMFEDPDSPIGKLITPVRIYSAHWDIAKGGVLEEMRRGLEPMPWNSKMERDETREQITDSRRLDEHTRRQLLDFVDRAPIFMNCE